MPAAGDPGAGHRQLRTPATSPPPTASAPTASTASSPPSPPAASSSATSASSRPTSWPARRRTPSATSRSRSSGRWSSASSSTSRSRWPSSSPCRTARSARPGPRRATACTPCSRVPFAEVATLLGIGWLATIVYADAIISPAGTGLIYTTGSSRVSYGLSRNGYVPTPFEWVNERGVPWVGPDRRLRHRLHLLPAVPELAVAGRADHQRQRADVRRRPAVARSLPQAPARRGPSVPAARGRASWRRWRSPSPA